MRRFIYMVLILAASLTIGMPTLAQTGNPNANISFPPPVYVVSGLFEIRGTVNPPGMSSYFVEFRELGENLQPDDTKVWFPAVLPKTIPVTDDVLGAWDTTLATDGVYEIRLTVTISGGNPITQVVSPIRVQNEPPPFVVVAPIVPTVAQPTQIVIEPTQPLVIVVTATPNPKPTGTVITPNGNVRAGDSTDFPIIDALRQGETVELIGISSTGSGWYNVRLANNRVGWMAPFILETSGDLSTLQRVQPPPPPATAIPTLPPVIIPPATAVPSSQANLVAGNVYLNPNPPNCGQTFDVSIDVANLGSQATTIGGSVRVADIRAADGSEQQSTIGGFGIIQPNQTVRVDMRLTVSTYYNETHRLVFTIDPTNQIPETSKSENTKTVEYTLQKANCP